ncbi:2'-5' RNA ligase family protein [Gottfriedia luciferensis]|uniref:2'-5' RNA ligase family protein n=1 Tax=Gottfriedia luciferensis TaxID=178774 RepID=UPI000B43B165|nr:2'-5' RNA ligase family protein [Gottfriedia luciferensis]
MEYFIGVVPPTHIIKSLLNFQRQWTNNQLIEVVEPHITIKAQGGLTSDNKWLKEVERVCASLLPFEINLRCPKFFGEDVLFLSVESTELNNLHKMLVEAVSPSKELIKTYFELNDYTPHLTIGQTNFGLTKIELKEMGKKAKEELTNFPTFSVDFVRVYQKSNTGKYLKYLDIPLKK